MNVPLNIHNGLIGGNKKTIGVVMIVVIIIIIIVIVVIVVVTQSTAASTPPVTDPGTPPTTDSETPTNALSYNDIIHLKNQYGDGTYLDTSGSGCNGNRLCVSTA